MSVKVTKKTPAKSDDALLEKASEPIKGMPDAEVLTEQIVKLSNGAAFAPVLKDHLTAITGALSRGDSAGAAKLLQRGLATLDSYTAAVSKLEAAATLFTAAADKYADANERIIAVLQDRASAPSVDHYAEAYERIATLEERVNAPSATPEFDAELRDRVTILEEKVSAAGVAAFTLEEVN